MSEFSARPSFTFILSSYVWQPGVHEIKIVPCCDFIGSGSNMHDASAEDLTVTLIYDLTSPICPGCGGNADLRHDSERHMYICGNCGVDYGEEAHSFEDGICKCGAAV